MFRRWIAPLVLGTSALATSTQAQCFNGPDNLTGPCWQPTVARIPDLPAYTLPGEGICWVNCDPAQQPIRIVIDVPVQITCGQYSAGLTVVDSTSGAAKLKGSLVLDYTRTWDEVDPTGASHQVYRFAAKIDMEPDTGSPFDPCLSPACFSAHPTAFYYGYLDYAFLCDSPVPGVEVALVLFHNCDAFIHPNSSATPGAFHRDTSYAVVGPSTPANPFVAAIVTPPAGALSGEAVRNVPPPGVTCIYEDPIQSGNLSILGAGCGCTFAPQPPQLTARKLAGRASCMDATGAVSTFQSANTMPSFPWFHMMTTAIGSWTTPMGYPGEEFAWVDEVPIFYRDTCAGSAFGEVYYGASTSKGWDLDVLAGSSLTDNFTDLASNTSWKVPGPPPSTFMGRVLRTRNLIYFNVP